MAIRLEPTVLVLLQEKLASLNLNSNFGCNARPVERQVVIDLYRTNQKMDKQDYLEVDESELLNLDGQFVGKLCVNLKKV